MKHQVAKKKYKRDFKTRIELQNSIQQQYYVHVFLVMQMVESRKIYNGAKKFRNTKQGMLAYSNASDFCCR